MAFTKVVAVERRDNMDKFMIYFGEKNSKYLLIDKMVVMVKIFQFKKFITFC